MKLSIGADLSSTSSTLEVVSASLFSSSSLNSRLDVICEVVFVGMEPDCELIGNRLAVDFSAPENLLRNSIQNLVIE